MPLYDTHNDTLTKGSANLADIEKFLCCCCDFFGQDIIDYRKITVRLGKAVRSNHNHKFRTTPKWNLTRSILHAFHTGKFLFTELLQKPEHILVMNLKSEIICFDKVGHTVISPETSLSSRYIRNNKPNKSHHLDRAEHSILFSNLTIT